MRVWRIKVRRASKKSDDELDWWLADSQHTPKKLKRIITAEEAGGYFLDAVGEVHATGEGNRILIQLKQPTTQQQVEYLKLNLDEMGIRILKKEK